MTIAELITKQEKTETPMSVYAAMVQRRYWRGHRGFKGFAQRGHSRKKRR